MFNSQILRSTAALSSKVAQQSAPRSIKVAINTSQISSLSRAFQQRVPTLFLWAGGLGSVMLWPLGVEKIVKATGGINNACS